MNLLSDLFCQPLSILFDSCFTSIQSIHRNRKYKKIQCNRYTNTYINKEYHFVSSIASLIIFFNSLDFFLPRPALVSIFTLPQQSPIIIARNGTASFHSIVLYALARSQTTANIINPHLVYQKIFVFHEVLQSLFSSYHHHNPMHTLR